MGASTLKFQKFKRQILRESESFPQNEERGKDQSSLHRTP